MWGHISHLGALVAVGTTATAGTLAVLGARNPRTQLFGETLCGPVDGSKRLALTFDDGPSEVNTPGLLAVLDRHKVPATFFMVGRAVDRAPTLAQRICDAGYEIGNHTHTHPNLAYTSELQTQIQIEACQEAISTATGAHPRLFRPPFGARNRGTVRAAKSLGLSTVNWSVVGSDWSGDSSDKIVGRVQRRVVGGDIVLLHDELFHRRGADQASTIVATDHLISHYREEGYEFVTASELLGLEHD